MGSFFNLDGPFYKFGNFIADIMILSLLWFVFSLPIVTIGASTSALFFVMTRRISDKEHYVFRDFWSSFKRNLKSGVLLTLLMLLFFGILTINVLNIGLISDNLRPYMFASQIFLLIVGVFMSVYVFPLLARFDMKVLQLLKSAFVMSIRHLPSTILCVIALAAVILGVLLTGGAFLFGAAGLYALATSYLLMRIFRKYRPEIDAPVDYDALRDKLRNESPQQSESDEPVFSDAAGLLIEAQAKENAKKTKK